MFIISDCPQKTEYFYDVLRSYRSFKKIPPLFGRRRFISNTLSLAFLFGSFPFAGHKIRYTRYYERENDYLQYDSVDA